MQQKPVRRVGTVTMGSVLILAGIAMACALFFPQWDFTMLLKGAPLILVALGIEVLVGAAHAKDGTLKYDWASMVLCCLVGGAALCMTVIAYAALYHV